MLKIRDPVPEFDCKAVVEGEVVQLQWRQVHANQNLLLLFESVDGDCDGPDDLAALCDAAGRFATLQCRLAVVAPDDEFEILMWMNRVSAELGSAPVGFPVIVDARNQIASAYDMLSADGPLRGHVIADADANVRSIVAHSIPVGLNVDALIQCVASIVESGDGLADLC